MLLPGVLAAAPGDVRLLIDVSGSMRQNDPNNLRVPALRLVNALLPAGARAGVWTFAERTETLAAPGEVDDDWRRRTTANLGRVHSRGLFTDIETALETAIADWDGPARAGERHVILLTDGLVDVAKDDNRDAASRRRILSEQLERLRELGVKVHAVALSDNVDTELLEALTERTGGWLESADDAEQLQRVFLHMLEQSAAPTTVPIEGNRFEIDSQVGEFTLLVFRAPGGETRLVSPDGQTLSATAHGPMVQWRGEPGYDLVTIEQPAPGRWILDGGLDPDNRVAVVTDLGIDAAPVPAALHSGDTLSLETWITDHGAPVTRTDFLKLLSAKAVLTLADDPTQRIDQPLVLDPVRNRFTATIKANALSAGVYELSLLIDGETFKRQLQRRIRVTPTPLTIDYQARVADAAAVAPEADGATTEQGPDQPPAWLRVVLNLERDQVDPESLFGYVRLAGAGKESLLEITAPTSLPMLYELPVERPGEYQVSARLAARTVNGSSILLEPPVETLSFAFTAPAEAPPPPPPQTFSWLTLTLYLLGGNLLLAGALGLTWWLFKRATAKRAAAAE
nr:vWA domain-containing protein [Marichromatium bheemlicum]